MALVVFAAASLPIIGEALPKPWGQVCIGLSAGCVALKAHYSQMPKHGKELEDGQNQS